MSLEIRGVEKRFGDKAAIHALSLEIREGEFFGLLGPSGCGKTTLLRMIAGFLPVDAGEIVYQGQPVHGLPAEKRPFNMVFQRYALFPHLTVGENIAFGLRLKGLSDADVQREVARALDWLRLPGYAARGIETLSGGEQQRVALARAIVNQPKVLLLDEPMAALDLKLRHQMQVELRALQRELKSAFVLVTHDQEEALSLCDRIAVMNSGRIEQLATGEELYRNPASLFVAGFIGETNRLKSPRGTLVLRPESVRLASDANSNLPVKLQGKLIDRIFRGAHVRVLVDTPESESGLLKLDLSVAEAARLPAAGQIVQLTWSPDAERLF